MQHFSQISSLFGYQLAEPDKFDIDNFTKFINEKFISREAATADEEIIAAATGKRLGKFQTKFIRAFGLDAAEWRDKKLEDVMDAAVKKYSTELEAKNKNYSDTAMLLGQTEVEFEKFKSESESKFAAYKINDKLSKVYAALNFIDGYEKDKVRKTGFDTLISTKYQFSLDDKDELIVSDSAGNRIKHPTTPTLFADPFTILSAEAEASNLLKKNNAKNPVLVNKSGSVGEQKFVSGLPLHKRAAARIKK